MLLFDVLNNYWLPTTTEKATGRVAGLRMKGHSAICITSKSYWTGIYVCLILRCSEQTATIKNQTADQMSSTATWQTKNDRRARQKMDRERNKGRKEIKEEQKEVKKK